MTDEHSAQLWDAFRRGDAEALATLFDANYDALYSYGRKLTSDEELVKDCIQNLFQQLWRRRASIGAAPVVKTYLFKALRRHLGDETKRWSRHRHLLPAYSDSFEVTYSHEEFLISQQADAEQQHRLLAALNQLSKRQREALYLRFFDGFPYERIAEVMSLNTQSVRNLIFRALQVLRQVMLASLALLCLLGA
ncbi:sigma-70 family RNA polymerase sigma factor [Hymenobacter sp. RP-2-7]|uniref:Sigma-70 family RNA polymerase sigma factor n=1 Tax=Hymenobacter polaris TaxID=2682546 RepID=A0A7Y0AFN8_9BACT|nr:sigma-70 family RNA polymerase sigma factor [Hymenobacter polaris]NML66245.1 sigma-70 family RNA polymerase sigma factor [Hymenobacter polaris]